MERTSDQTSGMEAINEEQTGPVVHKSTPRKAEKDVPHERSNLNPLDAGAKVSSNELATVSRRSAPVAGAAIAIALAALAGLTAWLWKRPSSRKGKEKQINYEEFLMRFLLPPSPAPPPPLPPLPLAGTTFVCSSSFDVESLQPTGVGSAASVKTLLAAGSQGVGRTITQEISLGMSQEGAPNPLGSGLVSGGTSSGVAMAVAGGIADIGVGIDHLAGARVAAGCCGLYAYRPTPGLLSAEGVSRVVGDMDTVAFVVRDASLLTKLGEALQLPGTGLARTRELARLCIASDLFTWAGGDAARQTLAAARAAGEAWAGSEQLDLVAITKYFADVVPALGDAADADTVIMNILGVVRILQKKEFAQTHRAAAAEGTATARVLELLEDAEVKDEDAAGAKEIAAQFEEALRGALKAKERGQQIVIIPTIPGPAITKSEMEECEYSYAKKTLALAAMATLAGVPQVTMPVDLLDGRPPMSISLLGMPKSDARLLAIAAKLAPMLAKAVQDAAAAAKATPSEEQRPNSRGSGATSPSGGRSERGGAAKSTPASGASAAARATAEEFKARGNEAYQRGEWERAVAAYSSAIQADASNPVYLSNRAMAYLKVLYFEQAEADCSAALALEPLNAKTLLRRGMARKGQQNFAGARRDFRQVLALEPNNRQARAELADLTAAEERMGPPGDPLLGSFGTPLGVDSSQFMQNGANF